MIEQLKVKFRVVRDDNRDPLIRCRNGIVYEHGPASLGVWINSRRPMQTFKALKQRLPALELSQVGDGEFTALLRFSNLKVAARGLRTLGAHRRRQYSPEVLAKYREQGRCLQQARANVQKAPVG